MKKSATLTVLMLALTLLFSFTASAAPISNPAIAGYGKAFTYTLDASDTHVFILPNARTTGTSINIKSSAGGTIHGHYYWGYAGGSLDLGQFVTTSTNYNTGSAYYSPGSLVLVLDRVATTTAAFPSVTYTISFN